MSLDRRRAALWQAMNLGPQWVLRSAPAAALPAGEQAAASEAPPAGERERVIASMGWDELQSAVAACTACGLCRSRAQTVFGVGSRSARWMIVGEAPGAEEDARGEPFVGQAGRLLDNMLEAIGRSRQADAARPVFIANVLKCRPPGNRNPQPEEVASCEPFLLRQMALVQPALVLLMGRFAAQAVLRSEAPVSALRGRVHRLRIGGRDVPAVVTYHPAYLLRNLADKAKAWADLCLALDLDQGT